MKKSLLGLLIVVFLLAMMCACSGEKSTDTTADVTTNAPDGTTVITTTAPPVTTLYPDDPENLTIALPEMSKYSVVSTEVKGSKLSKLVSDLSRRVETRYGITVNKLVDTETAPSEYEIIIGDTSREETKKAKELLGDNDYIITVIGNKLVIYSKIDEAYSAITDIVVDLVQKDGFVISRDYNRIRKYKALEETDITFESGKTLSLDITLEHKSSVTEFYLTAGEGADSYTIKLTDDTLSFFKEGEERKTLASVEVVSTEGKSYPFRLDFDGEHVRVFYVTVPEGYEPWPEFELKIGNASKYKLSYCETSGHGAVIDNLKLADYVSDISEGTVTYQNLVVKGLPDPEVFEHEGVYYLIGTGNQYPVYKSTDLINWTYVGKALPEVSWQGTIGYWWAPDVEYINGKFYMCVSLAANMFGFAVSDKPEGPYTCVGESFGAEIIDGNLFIDDDGKVYLYFTAWGNRTYGIYVVEMENDYVTPKWETEKLLFTPTESWEKDEGSVVEGAYMMKHEGKYYLLYSGSNYVGDYALGYAVSDKPNGGFKKAGENPILKGTADVKGVGHVSVVLAPDKETYVMFYHRHVSDTQVDPRDVCIDPMRFVKNEDGSYRIEVYGPTTSKRPAIWLN